MWPQAKDTWCHWKLEEERKEHPLPPEAAQCPRCVKHCRCPPGRAHLLWWPQEAQT